MPVGFTARRAPLEFSVKVVMSVCTNKNGFCDFATCFFGVCAQVIAFAAVVLFNNVR